jgi:flagellar basal-body rod modification protein FlgD
MSSSTYGVNSSTETSPMNSPRTSKTLDLGAGIGKDAFLELLVAQMKNQDPMNPADSSEFFSQLSQLTMLEQVWKMNENMDLLMNQQKSAQATSMIGKTVELKVDGGNVTGTVSGVHISETGVTLDVNGTEYALDAIVTVK